LRLKNIKMRAAEVNAFLSDYVACFQNLPTCCLYEVQRQIIYRDEKGNRSRCRGSLAKRLHV